MFFADVVGYSKFSEVKVAQFIQQFVGYLAQEMDDYPYKRWPEIHGGCLLFCVFLNRSCGSLCINTEGSNPRYRLGHTGTATWYNYGLHFIPIPSTGLQIRWFNNSIFPAFTLVRLSGSNRFKAYDSGHFASLIVGNNITDITCWLCWTFAIS